MFSVDCFKKEFKKLRIFFVCLFLVTSVFQKKQKRQQVRGKKKSNFCWSWKIVFPTLSNQTKKSILTHYIFQCFIFIVLPKKLKKQNGWRKDFFQIKKTWKFKKHKKMKLLREHLMVFYRVFLEKKSIIKKARDNCRILFSSSMKISYFLPLLLVLFFQVGFQINYHLFYLQLKDSKK